ncbi:hypothetical protein F503_01822 [Ophiostoma piceae UAMH 11346]|uniref:Uncharacterized protein n=1 Tax=Ophiostoma piceae (strain UAMH 11346) TaxID=1262450 RepID=S3BTX3_OPHP1|nr:hypothetical protein F503_01822 [Ophiostoma piceae UAMH 11346]
MCVRDHYRYGCGHAGYYTAWSVCDRLYSDYHSNMTYTHTLAVCDRCHREQELQLYYADDDESTVSGHSGHSGHSGYGHVRTYRDDDLHVHVRVRHRGHQPSSSRVRVRVRH